jgi:hypothetical protein
VREYLFVCECYVAVRVDHYIMSCCDSVIALSDTVHMRAYTVCICAHVAPACYILEVLSQ